MSNMKITVPVVILAKHDQLRELAWIRLRDAHPEVFSNISDGGGEITFDFDELCQLSRDCQAEVMEQYRKKPVKK